MELGGDIQELLPGRSRIWGRCLPIRIAARRSLRASLMGGCAVSCRFASAPGGPCIGEDEREGLEPGGPGGGGGGPGGGGAVTTSPADGGGGAAV